MSAVATPLYRLEGVVKAYGGREVCRVRHLEILPGEMLTILGPNGAGKSTLLRLLAFVESPDAGAIYFQGRLAHEGYPFLADRRQVIMVFQQPLLLRDTVSANVAYGLRLRGLPARDGRVQAALERLDSLEQVIFCCFSARDLQVYQRLLGEHAGTDPAPPGQLPGD